MREAWRRPKAKVSQHRQYLDAKAMIKKVPEDWQRNQKMSMPHIHERQHFVSQLQPDPVFPTTYMGRKPEGDFPCIELSQPNHARATQIERNFMIQKGLAPPTWPPPAGWVPTATWKDVTPREIIKVMKDGLQAAGAPADLWKKVLNDTNGWLRHNMHKWRCP